MKKFLTWTARWFAIGITIGLVIAVRSTCADPSPSPSPAILVNIEGAVNAIPEVGSTAAALIAMFAAGVLDFIARKWPTKKPRDVLRTIAGAFAIGAAALTLIAKGLVKAAAILDKVLGQNVRETPPASPPTDSPR